MWHLLPFTRTSCCLALCSVWTMSVFCFWSQSFLHMVYVHKIRFFFFFFLMGAVVMSKQVPRKQVIKQISIEGKLLHHGNHYLIAGWIPDFWLNMSGKYVNLPQSQIKPNSNIRLFKKCNLYIGSGNQTKTSYRFYIKALRVHKNKSLSHYNLNVLAENKSSIFDPQFFLFFLKAFFKWLG